MPRNSLFALLLLAGCQGEGGRSTTTSGDTPSATGLEQAAIESGVIANAAKLSPIGLFQRSHEAGRDALCVIPGRSGDFRFGTEAIFGKEERCRGQGTAKRAGDKLILKFSSAGGCIVVGQYDGDQLSLPGVLDMKCADLCDGRGSLEGVSFPRVGSDAASALRAQDRDGDPLCNPE
ncbi:MULTISPECIES: hypothetical protein [Sphingobium]|uniref:Lipoprotein n=1 Tax=Sphingobium tyrosinilyticum TaxID=2715436 RepID=A0ABV9EV87_9SPHN|nr:hypothetical protein [Sphingobium sp. EP60837]ANI76735.1 hypothetical protein EP837_00287 [Sphingobium sp. EP60837]